MEVESPSSLLEQPERRPSSNEPVADLSITSNSGRTVTAEPAATIDAIAITASRPRVRRRMVAGPTLQLLPAAVAVYLGESFLSQREVRDMAATCRVMVDSLRDYRIRTWIPLAQAVRLLHADANTPSPPACRWGVGQPRMVMVNPSDTSQLRHLVRLRTVRTLMCSTWKGKGSLPPGVVRLILAPQFDQMSSYPPLLAKLGSLPATLRVISIFGAKTCAQSLQNIVWPPGLVEFRGVFDVIPAANWPQSIRMLSFDPRFNSPIASGGLPDSLTVLSFGQAFDQQLESFRFPSSLERLLIASTSYSHRLVSWQLPLSCITLDLTCSATLLGGLCIPDHVQSLTLRLDCSKKLVSFAGVQLPSSLSQLTLVGSMVSLESLRWPLNLGPLKLTFERSVDGGFNLPLPVGHLPPSLISLSLGWPWNWPVSGLSLPTGLTSLQFGSRFDQPLLGLILPESLTNLSMGDAFNQSVAALQLPVALIGLRFGAQFAKSLRELAFPARLQRLSLAYQGKSRSWKLLPSMLPTAEALSSLTLLEVTADPIIHAEVAASWRPLLPDACELVLREPPPPKRGPMELFMNLTATKYAALVGSMHTSLPGC